MFELAAFYRFVPLADPGLLRETLQGALAGCGATGTVLVAAEGINGTIATPEGEMEAALAALRALPGCAGMEARGSKADTAPFGRLKVRLKREIVTLGLPEVDAARDAGRPIAASDWNAVLADRWTVAIDTRNAYEVALGTFPGALDPETDAFGDFPSWWDANAERLAGKRVAMFCTGGIRCEKSTAFLRSRGVEDVVHLAGGILGYLAAVPPSESLWQGRCFVYDERVSVGPGLVPGDDVMCRACRRPLTADETRLATYEDGVCCHRCADRFGEGDRARFRERARQMRLAEARGERHLGRA